VLHEANQSRRDELVQLLSRLDRVRVVAGPPDPTGCDIVVNATPMGMFPNDPLPVPAHLLTSLMFVGDVVARHGVTPFLQAARAAGNSIALRERAGKLRKRHFSSFCPQSDKLTPRIPSDQRTEIMNSRQLS
jgi:hypothetical protein